MAIKTSLRKKSVWALTCYLVFIMTVLGTVTYFAVEAPVRNNVEQKLELRTELLAAQIEAPINRSMGLLHSLAALGQTQMDEAQLVSAMQAMFANSNDIVASGGLWQHGEQGAAHYYGSLFFNKRGDGTIDRIHSYNNPESDGYHQEGWYQTAVDKPLGNVSWSEVYVDPFTQVQMITASEPYYVDGQFAGVATVDLSLKALFDFIHQHSERHSLGVSIRDANYQVVTEYNFQLVENIYIGRLEFGDFHWNMEVVNSRRLVADEVFDQVMSVERGVLPFLLLCVLAGYFLLNRYIVKPISRIARQVDHSKLGGIIDIRYSSQDEIGYLIEVINEKTVFLEQEKVKAQASTDAKTAFLATLSHEIRTPMNSVLGTAQLLKKTRLDDEQQKYLKNAV